MLERLGCHEEAVTAIEQAVGRFGGTVADGKPR